MNATRGGKPGAASVRQRGLALVMVLWVMTLLSVIAASFTLSMRRESQVMRNLLEAAQARQLADAGVYHAMLELLNPDPDSAWKADGSLHEIRIDGVTIRVQVTDESGKVDINSASDVLLGGLLAAAGVEEPRRQSLLAAILDWRDPSEAHRLHGADAAAYQAAGLPYGPRNEAFKSIEELQLVLGMTGRFYRQLEPSLTVFSQQSGINPELASRQTLLALPGVDAAQVDAYLEQRWRYRDQGLPAPPFPVQSPHLVGGGGMTYSVASSVRLPSGTGAGVEAVIRPGQSGAGAPFVILSWRARRGPEPQAAGDGN